MNLATSGLPSIDSYFNENREVILQKFRGYFESELALGRLPSVQEIKARLFLGLNIPLSFDLPVFVTDWIKKIDELAPWKDLLQNETITEIIAHSPSHVQYESERCLKSFALQEPVDAKEFQMMLDLVSIKSKEEWNYSRPFSSFFFTLGEQRFRVSLIHFSTTPDKGSKIFLRRIKEANYRLENFGVQSSEFFQKLILAKKNVLICGSTGSGKTSFMRALMELIPREEHLIILEDNHEIIHERSQWTSLLSREAKLKGLKDYCSYALRMRPDRIILGEMRSSEVVPFIMAMNTGHNGLMGTIHANSCKDALHRLGLLFHLYSDTELSESYILKLITQNIHYVVYLEDHKVKECIRVLGSERETPFFEEIIGKSSTARPFESDVFGRVLSHKESVPP